MNYRPEIDGLRAVAVLPVIFFHAGFDTFSGGFVGVDVFFVISGYLITSIILKEQREGSFTLMGFYERRARRILPALFLVLLCSVPLAWHWMLPIDFKDFSESLLAATFFSSNILFWLETGYFEGTAELKPLLHTWSLAVEEQYYIVFPLFILLAWRLGTTWIVSILAVAAVLSLAAAQLGSVHEPAGAFYLLPARGWQLLAGVFVAFYLQDGRLEPSPTGRWQRELPGFFGVALIAYAVFAYDAATPYPGFYALVPTIGTVLIILFAGAGTSLNRALSLKPVAGIGLISYGLYLWHQPLFAFARIRNNGEPTTAVYFLLTALAFGLAFLSWRYVERYFRNRRNRNIYTNAVVPSVLLLFFCVVGIDGHLNYDKQRIRTAVFGQEYADRFLTVAEAETSQRLPEYSINDCRFTIRRLSPDTERHITRCAERFGSGLLVLGDSHAVDLFGAMAENLSSEFVVGIANGGCRPHDNYGHCAYDSVLNLLARYRDLFSTVVFTQAGSYLLRHHDGEPGSTSMFDSLAINEPVPSYPVNREAILDNIDYLSELARYSEIIWLGIRFEPHLPVKRSFLDNDCSFQLRPNHYRLFASLDEIVADAVARSGADISYVSQLQLGRFDPDTDLASCDSRILYWADGDHWSTSGERYFGRRIVSALKEGALLFDEELSLED